MTFPHFKFFVYNPNYQTVDVAKDWACLPHTTTDYEHAMFQPYKIAAVTPFYNDPSFFNYNPAVPTVDLSQFDLVLVSDPEYYTQAEVLDWVKKQGIKNYIIALGGLRNNEVLESDVFYRPYWLSRFLSENTQFVDTYSDHKPYLFEALLGSRRPHRDFVMLALTKTGLLDKSIVTYRDGFPGGISNDNTEVVANEFSDVVLNRPYVSPNLDPAWEVRQNIDNTVSFIVPEKIYQATHYSIVCETLGEATDFFFSEKIMKPLFAKRLFVVFGSREYLKKLRSFGFVTFDCFLDESYDQETLDIERYKKAMMQVMKLAWLEKPSAVKEKVNWALEHNHQRLYAWQRECQGTMLQLLLDKVGSQHFNYN